MGKQVDEKLIAQAIIYRLYQDERSVGRLLKQAVNQVSDGDILNFARAMHALADRLEDMAEKGVR